MIVLALRDYREYLISTGALKHDEAHAPLSEAHNPWIGVGPDRSRALTFSSADNKGLQAGVVESNGAVSVDGVPMALTRRRADKQLASFDLFGSLAAS
ncbi:hypothetical protein WJX72_009613 [[Myrmecia] bisecta]|uniref:Uncharacterized protein n=1 Tax=[Myrmecia] bisecta TaxID=41462 RepID=A0AAW1P062_9CHLO